jgi:hypothetical protein
LTAGTYMKKNCKYLLGLCLALALVSTPVVPSVSGALALPPGSPPVALGATPVGGVVVANLVSPFAGGNGKFSGTLTTTIWVNDPNNPLGGLTFQYTLFNNPNSIDSLERLTLIDWATSPVALVDNVAIGGTVFAAAATRTAPPGDTIGFSWSPFTGQIMPGATGSVLIQTPLKAWKDSVASVLDGGTAAAATFAPVPEPTTIIAGAGALGLLLLGAGVHTKRSKVIRIG